MTPDELSKRGLRVKPLTWMLEKPWYGEAIQTAITAFGPYNAGRDRTGCFFWMFNAEGSHDANSEEEALAAAQADYEARTIAPLECVADPILAAEVRGMEMAARIMDRRHAEFMGGKGRNPADYTSAYSISAESIRAAAKEMTP